RSGSSGAPITYQATGQVIIDQTAYSATINNGMLIGVNYIVLDGFEISHCQSGIYLSGGPSSAVHDDWIKNCVIHDCVAPSPNNQDMFLSLSAGIYNSWAYNNVFINNVIYNIGTPGLVPNNPYLNNNWAFCIGGPACKNVQIYNNTLDKAWAGLMTWVADASYTVAFRNNVDMNMWGAGINHNQGAGTLTDTHNLFYTNTADYANVSAGTSELYGYDPRFVNAAGHDYTLQSNSPAVNGGVDTGIAYNGPAPDMGAYESTYTQNDEAGCRHWVCDNLLPASTSRPFLFYYTTYGFSYDVLPSWSFTSSVTQLDANRTQRTLTYTAPDNRLRVQCIAVEYINYPAVEWTVYFQNVGTGNTKVLNNVRGMWTKFLDPTAGDFTLWHAFGSTATVSDFQPLQAVMGVGTPVNLWSRGGRSSDTILPFFNLQKPDGNGIAIGIGWSGQWQATFNRTDQYTLFAESGMTISENLNDWLNAYLTPGELIRTPASLLVWWSGGDKVYGQNQLRKMLYDYYTPKPGNQLYAPTCTAWAGGTFESRTQTLENATIDAVAAHTLPIDTYWIDAGWTRIPSGGTWAQYTGNWTPDPVRFPDGIAPISNHAHSHGYNFLLWFEPERAMPNTDTYTQHPSNWFLSPSGLPAELSYQSTWHLLNLGKANALAWAKSYFSGLITSYGVDVYRQDFNMHPLYYWHTGESSNRAGINQIKYIMGLYAYLDYLMAQHPNLLIDNCASGGRRIDFEMMKRSLTLTRSDYLWDPVGQQCMTYGLSQWLPITGIGSDNEDTYKCRSGYGSVFTLPRDWPNVLDPNAWALAYQNIEYQVSVKDLFRGDFYPLTPYSTATDVWMAWQFDRPDLGRGIWQAFRRPDNPVVVEWFYLKGLVPNANYELTSPSIPGWSATHTGQYLMETGFEWGMAAGESQILEYRRL
ncbi:MAG: alpha-galactosidase, partial [Armatimonadota bacterium]